MNKENIQTIYDIYENDAANDQLGKETIDNNPTRSGHLLTGSDSVMNQKAAVVCLVLLCFLLLTAVILLSVFINTNNTQERELLTMIISLTKEKTLLQTNITDLSEERDELLTRNTDLTEERNKLTIKTLNLSIERDQFKFKIGDLTNQLNNTLQIVDEWTYYEFSFYYVSNENKSWTESRRDCLKRGADLIIINNRQEHDFIMSFTRGKECWIGLTDIDVEDRWKWVDGTNMTSGIWAFREPNGGTAENCVVTYLTRAPYLIGWIDDMCSRSFQYICEKNISPLIQP